MSGLIPQAFIEDLLHRVPIAEVVGSRVQLKKAGGSLKACCPFHQEKTPSFHVNAQKNYYHCFGCGVNGNSINFLRDHDNLTFNEAVEELAKFAGVEVPRDERVREAYSAQKKLWEAMEYAQLSYRNALKNHATKQVAQDYLARRGVSEDIAERFGIGFAPAERSFLGGRAQPDILKALIQTKTVSNKYESLFDLFQNRLMFPIRNPRGKTIAFGGRTLGDDKAKYINSPESEIFHKSSEVYGLYEANQANRQLDKLLIVEGYMDVVSLAQFGIDYAVATLGTATNTESLSQLLKRCSHLIFCFDGDYAGVQAARKAMENLLPLFEDGLQVRFLLLPEGEDPDTLVRHEGRDAFERRIIAAKPLSEFFFQIYSDGLDLNVAENRALLKQRAEPHIEQVQSAVLKSGLRQKLNEMTFRRPGQGQFRKPASESMVQTNTGRARVLRDSDTALCLALYYDPTQAETFLEELEGSVDNEKVKAFASFIRAKKIQSQEDLLYCLATDQEGFRDQFFTLFDRLEFVPERQESLLEAEDILSRYAQNKKQSKAINLTKINKLPSQMTAEEKQALKAISSDGSN